MKNEVQTVKPHAGNPLCKRVACLLLSAAVFAGCDPFWDSKDDQLALERQRHENVRRERDEQERFARALTEYANGKQKLVKETIGRLEGDIRMLTDDIEKLSRIVALGNAEKSSAGKELPRETKLLHLLRNPEVNGLAKKYLAADFVLQQHEFIDRVRDARVDEGRYRKALSQSDATYTEALKESRKWVNATKEQRDAEISRLKSELSSWERRRAEYHKNLHDMERKALVGNVSQERERRERLEVIGRKIEDADREISRKRGQIDLLRDPNANAGMEGRAAQRKQDVQRQANYQRENELHTIDRYYKPKATVVEVVIETSKQTVEKLQGTMAGKRQTAEKELADAKRKEVEIKECLLAIPVSNMTELKALRAKMEK